MSMRLMDQHRIGIYVEVVFEGVDGLDAENRALAALGLHEGRELTLANPPDRGGVRHGQLRRVVRLNRALETENGSVAHA
jgi:hypothetical protein